MRDPLVSVVIQVAINCTLSLSELTALKDHGTI